MLLESDVIDAVCSYLESQGYQILQKLSTGQKGDDIIAMKKAAPRHTLFAEAKGGTSSSRKSARYGKPFSSSQIRVHVAEAFYKAAEVLSRDTEDIAVRAAIALPDTKLYRKYAEIIKPVLMELGIAVLWVDESTVLVRSTWGM
jgi:Holliday junction resolvase-like predicted endonuclease